MTRCCGDAKQEFLRHSPRRANRSGHLLVELIVAMILLGAVMSIIVPAVGWIGEQTRLSLQKQEAIQELHNLMDDLTSRPYAELTPQTVGKIELPAPLKTQLSGAILHVEVTETQPTAKRIHAELSWNQRDGNPLAPLRLTAWVHLREDAP